MKRKCFALTGWMLLLCPLAGFSQSDLKLWYTSPAQYFEETLVLGNGTMGATVFGGVDTETIYLNDITLWTGEPVNANMNPDAYKNIPAIRSALQREDYRAADSLQKKVQGKYSESYAPLGTVYIHFPHSENIEKYYRELDLSNALSRVSYRVNGVEYSREYFVSHPDKTMAFRLATNKKGSLNAEIFFKSLLKYKTQISGKEIRINGYAPVQSLPNYLGERKDNIVFDENRGTRFTTLIKAKNTDGIVIATDSSLIIRHATEVVVLVSEATSFNGFDKNPATNGKDNRQIAQQQMDKSAGQSYQQLKLNHTTDYRKFFNRVRLSLGKSEAPVLPTNERLLRYASGSEDKNLEVLYFQYGRYLLISSSRTPGVPANLQGLWNPYMRPPWSSNYTTNINLEENYWPAEVTNLSEMHSPLLSFIDHLSQTGKITAQTFFGCRGWTACHNSDIWAMSNPVGNGSGDPLWANWYMGGAWLSNHLWEHFLFTRDTTFLRTKAYKVMKGAAEFCLDWLVEDKNGNLITSPCTSPENHYVTPDGYHGATFYGGFADMAMIRSCLKQIIEAASILNIDGEFAQKAATALARLLPYRISKTGGLQEWYYDWDDEDPHHRHQSHLFGLYPGAEITPQFTPGLANAFRRTLDIKGDETTGWSKGWRINLWARLGDGNRAYKMFRELLRYVDPDGVKDSQHRGGGTYPNLFDAHPPFQIDGNFGGTAAIAEMLVQSHAGYIQLLPALPGSWSSGHVSGLRVRGGGEIALAWNNGEVVSFTLKSDVDNDFRIRIPDGWNKELINASGFKNVKTEGGYLIVALRKNETVCFLRKR